MITIEKKREVIRLHEESRSKSEISRLTHISRPKVLEIIRENGEIEKLEQGRKEASELMSSSIKAMKSELSDYEKALRKIRDAANDELLGPSVRKAIGRNGFILKESASGIREQISSFLDGLNVRDALKMLEILRDMANISALRNVGSDELKRYLKFSHYVIKKAYTINDMDFLIKNGPLLSKFRDYQGTIDRIASTYGVSEPEAIFFAFQGLNDYYKKVEKVKSVG